MRDRILKIEDLNYNHYLLRLLVNIIREIKPQNFSIFTFINFKNGNKTGQVA